MVQSQTEIPGFALTGNLGADSNHLGDLIAKRFSSLTSISIPASDDFRRLSVGYEKDMEK
jgi:hypothetical protein